MSRIPLEQSLATETPQTRRTARVKDREILVYPSLCLRCLCGDLMATLEQVAAFDQGAHLAVGDAPVEHPEAAIRMNIFEPALAGLIDDHFDARGDELWAFNFVVFDVNDTDAEADVRIEV